MISARFSLFNRERRETIHHSSLDILRRAGVHIPHDGALSLLRETDAMITDRNLVRFPAGLVEWALKQQHRASLSVNAAAIQGRG